MGTKLNRQAKCFALTVIIALGFMFWLAPSEITGSHELSEENNLSSVYENRMSDDETQVSVREEAASVKEETPSLINQTPTKTIPAPTRKNERIRLPAIQEEPYVELLSERGQSYRHWYNSSSGSYTYRSDYLVREPGIYAETPWVTYSEVPIRFVLKLINGSSYSLTDSELVSLIGSLANSSIAAVGIRTFGGMFSIAQGGYYEYYPRWKNCTQSTEEIFRLVPQANADYLIENAQDDFVIANQSDLITVQYSEQVGIGQTWSFTHFLHYNLTLQAFKLAHSFSYSQNLADLGFYYEVATKLSLSGLTAIFENNTISVESSNVGFSFNISDFETAGFGLLTAQTLNSSAWKIGRGQYGSYTKDSLIEIDPTFSEKLATDAHDGYSMWEDGGGYTAKITDGFFQAGYGTGEFDSYWNATLAWDTGITDNIASSSNAEMTVNVHAETVEPNEYHGLGLYDKGDTDEIWNETEISGNPQGQMEQDLYYSNDSFHCFNGEDEVNVSMGDGDMGVYIDQWVTHHNGDASGRQFIAFFWYNGTGLDPGNADHLAAQESSTGTASERPTLTFDYTLSVSNNAPNAPTLNQDSGDTFSAKTHTIKTDHTDDDGETDIETMYLQYDYSGANITLSCPQDTSSGSVTILTGSAYLIGTPTYSHTTEPTNGHRVTWTIELDWDWTPDDTTYEVEARTVDDEPEWSAWTLLDSDNAFENDLIIKSLGYDGTSFPNGIGEGNGSSIDDTEPTRGSMAVDLTGVVCYQGALTTYPNTDAVDVELNVNGADTGTVDTTLGSSGEFDLANYTIAAATDTDYDYNITLTGWSGSGSSGSNYDYSGSETQCSNGVHIDSSIDADAPTGATLTHADSDSDADGYEPNNGYDDDTSMEYTMSGATDAGVGLASNPYRYRWDSGSYGAWNSSTTVSPGSSDGTTADADAEVRDGVGNTLSVDGEDVTCDTTHPTVTDPMSAYNEDSGNLDDVYGDISTDTFYFSNSIPVSATVTFTATMSDTNVYGIDFGAFGEDPALDDSSPYTGQYIIENADTSGSITVTAVDQAGNTGTDSITCTEDATNPTISQDTLQEKPDSNYQFISGTTVYFSDLMGGTDVFFEMNITASDGSSGLYCVNYPLWDDDASWNDTSSPYSRIYSTDSSETSGTLTFTAYDNVGNTNTIQITMTEDTAGPTSLSGLVWAHADAYGDNATTDDDTTIMCDWSNITDASSGLAGYYAEINDTTPDNDGGVDCQYSATGSSGYNVFYVVAYDNVGNNGSSGEDGITITLSGSSPVLDGAVFTDESFSPNWYDQGVKSIATINITWHDDDNDADFVWIIVVGIDTYYNSSPSGNFTIFEIAISGESDGDYSIEFYINDTAANEANDTTGSFGDAPLRLDDTAPSISVTGETESSIYLYAAYGTSTQGCYGSEMGSTQEFNISGTASDAGSDMSTVTDNSTFGDDPSNTGSATAWLFRYTIDAADNGNVTIQYTATDNVGNTNTATYIFFEDNVNPAISITGETESSIYLYAAYGTSTQGCYGSEMGSSQTYTVSGTASDSLAAMNAVTDNSTFGDDPSNGGSATSWSFAYTIDSADNGNVTIQYNATDNVGNNNSVTYTFFEDNTAPTAINAAYCHADAFGDNATTDDDTEIFFDWTNVTDAFSGLNDFFCEIGDNTPDESGGLDLQDTDSGSNGLNTFFVWARDNVGNYNTVVNDTITITVDPPGARATGTYYPQGDPLKRTFQHKFDGWLSFFSLFLILVASFISLKFVWRFIFG